MKHAPLILLSLLLFTSAAIAADLVTIKDTEASNHIGEKVEVRGYVSKVHRSRKGNISINMGRSYPDQTFIGFVPAASELSDDSTFLHSLEGKEIGIVGMAACIKESRRSR